MLPLVITLHSQDGTAKTTKLVVTIRPYIGDSTMSNIVGTYKNDNIGAILTISKATDSKGEIVAASLGYEGHNYPAIGHYQFKDGSDPKSTTIVSIEAWDRKVAYFGLAMTADNLQFKALKSFGGLATYDGKVIGLGGTFVRQ